MKAPALFAHVDDVSRASPRTWIAMAGVLASCLCGAAWSAQADDEAFAQTALSDTAAEPSPARLELNTSLPPRLDNPDGPFSTTRLDITGWPRQNGSARNAVGLSLGLSVSRGGLQDGRGAGPGQETRFGQSVAQDARYVQSVDLGVRWRSSLDSNRRIDVSAWRRVTPAPDAISLINTAQPDLYGTRVEMQFTARKSALVPELGAIGVQLSGGAKLSLRTRHGKPMLYYRARF